MFVSRVRDGLLVAALAAAVSASPAAAQSMFLDDGASGFDFNAGYLSLESGSGFGGSAGFSVLGLVDIGLGVNSYSFDEGASTGDVAALGVVPRGTLHLLRQSGPMPFGLTLGGSYEWLTYSGDILDDADLDMRGALYTVGGGIYRKIRVNPVIDVLPTLHVAHRGTSLETEDPLGNVLSADDTGTDFSFTPVVGLSVGPVNVLHLNPTVTINEDSETSFELSLGFALPTKIAG